MKIWVKLLIGAGLGLALGCLLPIDNQMIQEAFSWLEGLVIKIGRYTLMPLLFFSLVIAIFELRQTEALWKLALVLLGLILLPALILPAFGLLMVILFPPARIPILIDGEKISFTLGLPDVITELFPANAFQAISGNSDYLLPLAVLAGFLGAGLSYDRNYTKALSALIDSLSRVFYYVSAFFSEIIGGGIIILAGYWAIRFRHALDAVVFRDILVLLGITTGLLSLVILPLLLFLFGPKTNPWKQLYGAFGPMIAGWFSGDILFCLPLAFRHAKENHGVKRRVNTLSLLTFSSFGRSGSAMVAAVSLIIIIKSYSSLGVTLTDLGFIWLHASLLSFALVRHPGNGAFAALAVLCGIYGRGFEAGYLILKPIAFYLIAIGTFLDVLVAMFASYAAGRLSGLRDEREARHFI